MQLADYLDKDLILPDLKSDTKPEVLEELLAPLQEKVRELDLNKARDILLEREKLGSTGIGNGVAIPHGKMEELESIVLAVGRSLQGVDFDALDQEPCTIFFLVLAPENVAGTHLRLLAHISRLLKDPEFQGSFMEARGWEGLFRLLDSV
ncbi:MAG: PTS sugar transporter subunit IIA [Desulfohalobiaceae bacterium]|nr:PTS sugar transporter subunit IIA [Desulfohalobiaceae bacterium]